jgi:hypothetical protein
MFFPFFFACFANFVVMNGCMTIWADRHERIEPWQSPAIHNWQYCLMGRRFYPLAAARDWLLAWLPFALLLWIGCLHRSCCWLLTGSGSIFLRISLYP